MGAAALVVSQFLSGLSVGFTGPLTAAAAQGPTGHPNRFNANTPTSRPDHLPKPPTANVPKPTFSQPRGMPPVPMKAALVALDPVAGAHFLGSDGMLELTVPPGAVTAADVKAAGGSLNLLVRQLEPGSGSSAGGSGHVSFGTWLVQVVDGSGRPAAQGLRHSFDVKLHQSRRAGGVDLAHTRVLVNGPLPSWVNLDPGPTAAQLAPASGARRQGPSGSAAPSTVKPALGPTSHHPAALDAATMTLSSSVPMASQSASMSFGTDAPVAAFGRPDPFETDLAGGSLSAGIQLDLPAGPGGLTPPLTLSYSSASVSDQHNAQAAAPWVGEGWNLGLGAISWAEHQVDMTGCQQCTAVQWEDSWQLSDPYGTAADLVPPDVNRSTYLDDTGNGISASPITWHTAPETHARVISFSSGIAMPNNGPVAPCWRVFLPNGIMEEFGCVANALQFYPEPGGTNLNMPYIANWLLDLITDPQGNQIHVTYQSDPIAMQTMTYARDIALATVEYDSPGCRDAQVMCTGANWAPLIRVNFAAGHSVAHVNGSSCAANGTLRCDDPVDESGSGGVAAPLIQSDFVLNDAQVQVRGSGSASWNTLRNYQFSYDQGVAPAPNPITDPVTGTLESIAGKFLLTRLQVIGADGATSLPARTFGYGTTTEYYEDVTKSPMPSTNCGPPWNNGQKPNINLGCVLWSQSYAGNSYYLNSVSNGLGLSESFTWQLGRNNFYGAPSGSSPADPLVCDNTSVQSSFPCNMPDNQTWSRAVLTQRQDSVLRTSNNPVTSTWSYAYQVQYPLAAQECSGCVASFYWGNQNDFDALDFYNNKFMGFAQTSVQNPDNGVEIHKFLTTQGFGIYDTSRPELVCNTPAPCHSDPYWALGNAAHGHEYELDQDDANGTTLLKQAKTQWSAVCPPPGVTGTPYNSNWGTWDGGLVTELDHSNPVMVCDVHRAQVDQYTFDGTAGAPVHSATAYTYDAQGRVASQAQVANTGATAVADSSGHGNGATLSGGTTEQMVGLVSGVGDTAMSLDGSSGYVAAPALTPMQGDNSRSVEVWFSTTSASQQVILDGGGLNATGQSFILGLTQVGGTVGAPGNTPGVYLALWSDDVYLPNLNLANGQPHHLVVTLSGSSLDIYVDGATPSGSINGGAGWGGLVGQPFALPSVPNTAANPLWLGRGRVALANIGSAYFSGALDEAAVYDHALTAARVQAHFTAASGYRSAVLADTPTAYYRLDDGAGGPGPNTIVNKPQYVQDDAVAATASSATGHYLIDYPAFDDVEDTSGNRYQCGQNSYDGQAFATGQSSLLTLGEKTTSDRYTACGTAPNFTASGQIRTTSAFDVFGNLVAHSDADANGGIAGHTGCTVGSTAYSACTTYDGTFGVLPTISANVLNQTTTTAYQAPTATAPAVVQDGSGHGYNATPGTAVTFGAAGLVSGDSDTAMSFNGTAASTVNLDLPSVDTTSGHQVTVELWLKYSGSFGMPFGFNRYDLWLDSSGLGFNTAGGDNYGVPLSAVPTNTPVHVVAVFTNGSVTSNQLYINGVAQTLSQLRGTPSSQTVTPHANISGWGRDGNNRFNGTIGKVAIYNGALSATQVQTHYGAGSGYNAAVLADSPIAYYRLNDTAAQGGFGLWPTSTIDANGNTANRTYDALGRETSHTLPVTTIADSGGHGYSGVPNGALTYGAQGMTYIGDPDGAITFRTGGAYGTVNLDLPTVDTTAGHQVTVEFWMNYSGSGGGMPFGFNQYDVWLDPASGLGFNTAGGDNYGVPISSIPANTPLHVVAVFTNGGPVTSNALYINGVAQSLSQLRGTPGSRSATTNANISGWAQDRTQTFPGTVDEVAVYNGALSSSRVQAHFNAGPNYKSTVLADSPLAYYRLDEDNPPATETTAYTVWCSGTAAQTPCVEVDKTQRLNSTTTTTSRSFYDGLGHLVETRSPAPGGQDVVRYSFYDASQRLAFQSVPYFVTAYSGPPGSAAYSVPDGTQQGTTYDGTQNGITTGKYDGLGRSLVSTDALGHTSTRSYSVVCAPPGTGDPGCYQQTLSSDPNGHQGGVLVDGMDRTAYVQRYTGNSTASYALYATAKYTYDVVGDLVRIVQPDGSTQTTFGYDMAGRKTAMTDPDLGGQSYTYDQDGNLTQSVDARGGAGTIFVGYDGLDRPIWRNTTNSPTGAYDTYGYDSTGAGDVGVGRLTSETFATGALSGSYAYSYDPRGQQTASTLTVNGAAPPPPPSFMQQANNHAASVSSLGATFASNVTAGDRIVAVVGVWNNGATASGVADSAGNTYTKVAGLLSPIDGTEETIWTAPITVGGGTKPTVTATASGTADIGIAVSEYSGLSTAAGSASVDQSAIASGTSSGASTVSSGATPATTAGGELAVGAYVDSGFGDTLNYGSGWGGRVNVSPTSDMELAVEDQVVGQGVTPNAQVGTSASSTWLMATVVFKGATGGGSAVYTTQSSYDDASNMLTQTYPDGQAVTNSYTAQGWLSGVTTTQGSTTLASNLAYTGTTGGAFGEITGATLGNGTYTYSATYDLLDRATDLKTTKTSGGTVMFDQQRTFDPAGNVTTIATTMPGATDNQSFCYDEQDRLTWASSATATPPCGGSNTAGTLTAAQYTQTFSYDVLGRLTSGPLGTYTYGSSAHVHAATGIGTTWTSAYDAAGNMTCRAPSSSSTCAGTQTGAQLGYNNEGELASWQNAPSNPSTTAQFLYDGQGQRVEQSVTQSGTTTTTVYVGDVEEVSTTGGTTMTTAYYYAGGKRIGLSVNGVVSYLASDGLGSAAVTLSISGSATAAQLFAPYGGVRYSSGTMPTTYGFTGQRSDAVSGMDYYGARYYDPLAGQFASGDSVAPGGGFDLWGLSRYSYVSGNPIIRVDPTGHIQETGEGGGCDPVDPGCGGGQADTPPADPCGGACYYDYTGSNGGTSYNPPPADPTSPYRPRGGDPERSAPSSSPSSDALIIEKSGGDVSRQESSSLPSVVQAAGDLVDSVFGISATDAAIDRVSRGEGTPDDYLQIALLGGSVHDDPFANSTKEDIARIAENLSFDGHATDQMADRGWTQAMVRQLVANPKRIVRSLRDTRYNPITRSHNNFPATAYVDADGNYVIVRNIDGDVVQVNDRGDPTWKNPF